MHVLRVVVAELAGALAAVLAGDASGSVLGTGHGIPPGREAWPSIAPGNENPADRRGTRRRCLLGSSPIVPVSGLALAPCWRSAGCRAVDGPEPSRLS